MEDLSKFITLKQYSNKWQSNGSLKIDPTHISYVEHITLHDHSKIHTIFGQIIEVEESPAWIEILVNDWYAMRDKTEKDKIVLTKDDIVKNFIFKSMSLQ